jgi:hypothetical protein
LVCVECSFAADEGMEENVVRQKKCPVDSGQKRQTQHLAERAAGRVKRSSVFAHGPIGQLRAVASQVPSSMDGSGRLHHHELTFAITHAL